MHFSKHWKKESIRRPQMYRSGYFGNNCHVDNAHTIEFGTHYNGSGKEAFNGSTSWPVLEVQISFVPGQEKLREQIASQIARIIDEAFPPGISKKEEEK